MLSRRRFATCALCAAGGVLMAEVGVRAQTPGLTRTLLNKTEYPGDKMVTLQMLVEIDPNFLVPRHTHPGVESSYVVEGGVELTVEGEGTKTYAPGEGFQVPPGVPHSGQNGPAKTVLAATYVVEKGKPLASPA